MEAEKSPLPFSWGQFLSQLFASCTKDGHAASPDPAIAGGNRSGLARSLLLAVSRQRSPLTWSPLDGAAADLPAAFLSPLSDLQNCSLPPDRSVPFQLFIMQWQQRLTYLQLVASHTALDSKSLVILIKLS